MATITENLQTIQSSLADIKTAIVDKGVEVDGDITTYADKIASIETGGDGGTTPSRPQYTGHADADGLRAIGWTDEDIAYYQANGVNWNEEDDEYHKVTDDNKALYGVLTASNISTYKDRIVYLPKIDTSGVTNMYYKFERCYSLVAIPFIDTSNVTNMTDMFANCCALTCIPQLDTSKVTTMLEMFYRCRSLVFIPPLDTSKAANMTRMFGYCCSLTSIPQLNTSSATRMSDMFSDCYSLISIPQLDTSKVTEMYNMFRYCNSLVFIPPLDTSKAGSLSQMFDYCYSLTHANIDGITSALDLSSVSKLTKESLLYIINNEVATRAITIKLHSYAYTRLAEDADVVAALANHPNISLASA